jgi:ABC-type glycerol-3-phosphate transport system permease component
MTRPAVLTETPVAAGGLQESPALPVLRRSRRPSVRTLVAHHGTTALLILGALLMAFPILWMISLAFQPSAEIYQRHPNLVPAHPTLDNFITGLTQAGFAQYYLNSSFVTTTRVILTVIINALAGFAFAKYSFRGKGILFLLVLSAMMIPDQVRMVPLYQMFNSLGLVNSYWSVILPGVGATFGTFLMTQYSRSVPDELLEAARIDGASEWRVFRQVVIPLVTPALVTNVIFQFIWGWNDLLYPLLFLQDDSKYTLPLALASLGGSNALGIGPVMAMSLLTIIPVLIVFFALQRFFVEGIAAQGIKG